MRDSSGEIVNAKPFPSQLFFDVYGGSFFHAFPGLVWQRRLNGLLMH
jgi:hypothetical protein